MSSGTPTEQAQDYEPWVKVQHATFSRLFNVHLRGRFGKREVERLGLFVDKNHFAESFTTSVTLMHLVHAMFGVPMPRKYNKAPALIAHKLDNAVLAIQMLEKAFPGVDIKPIHIATGNHGMILALMSHIAMTPRQSEDQYNGILQWSQSVTEGYAGVHITDLSTSWADGLGYCALLHAHTPNLIDFTRLGPDDIISNLTLASSMIEKQYGVKDLLIEGGTPHPNTFDAVATSVGQLFQLITRNERQRKLDVMRSGTRCIALALLTAHHPRCGANSPTQHVPCQVILHIADLGKKAQVTWLNRHVSGVYAPTGDIYCGSQIILSHRGHYTECQRSTVDETGNYELRGTWEWDPSTHSIVATANCRLALNPQGMFVGYTSLKNNPMILRYLAAVTVKPDATPECTLTSKDRSLTLHRCGNEADAIAHFWE
ncbi:hypothetical protein Pelo_9201 [Pelomyxa schiedti]|nr:hypothetical protein Pelo_9201 [Pelomyxa schiedti]